MLFNNTLISDLTAYDKRMSTLPGYDPSTMALYFEAAGWWQRDPATPADPTGTLKKHFIFNGRRFALPPVQSFYGELNYQKMQDMIINRALETTTNSIGPWGASSSSTVEVQI